ncbi:MAG: PfkB family carbohydrate kinase [Ignavibacteriales bacterium]|nr:PfkB family carbohydrate kinase [Ignavibacteriales bacterium]
MKNLRVTAIGEILYDVYSDRKRLGGASFNFIYHIWKILGKANFISSVGNDDNGKEMLSYLNSIGFNTNHIYIDKKYPTGTVQVKLSEDRTPQFTISPECSYDYLTLNNSTTNLIEKETDLLYFGTLSTRSDISRNTIQSLFGKPHLKYFCDLNLRHNFYTKELIKQTLLTCNVLKINQEELDKLKQFFNLDQSNKSAIEQLTKEFDIDLIGLTLGENGAELYNKNETNYYKTEFVNVVDTLGAGDAYAAILCLGYLYKMPIGKMNKLANEFAWEICMVNGALPKDDTIYEKYRIIFN